jgi:hypothetical protein
MVMKTVHRKAARKWRNHGKYFETHPVSNLMPVMHVIYPHTRKQVENEPSSALVPEGQKQQNNYPHSWTTNTPPHQVSTPRFSRLINELEYNTNLVYELVPRVDRERRD